MHINISDFPTYSLTHFLTKETNVVHSYSTSKSEHTSQNRPKNKYPFLYFGHKFQRKLSDFPLFLTNWNTVPENNTNAFALSFFLFWIEKKLYLCSMFFNFVYLQFINLKTTHLANGLRNSVSINPEKWTTSPQYY